MKEYFFFLVLAIAAITVVAWFSWTVVKALYTVVSDWRLGRELDELEAECRERRLNRKEKQSSEAPVVLSKSSPGADSVP